MKNAAFSAFILTRQAMLRLRLMYLFTHYSTEVRKAAVSLLNDDGVFSYHKDVGLVNQVFDKETLERLGKGNIAIGHVSIFDYRQLQCFKCSAACCSSHKGSYGYRSQRKSY